MEIEWNYRKGESAMRTNQVKEKLKRGEPALGAWLSLPSVPSAEGMRIDENGLIEGLS